MLASQSSESPVYSKTARAICELRVIDMALSCRKPSQQT